MRERGGIEGEGGRDWEKDTISRTLVCREQKCKNGRNMWN